MAMNEVELWKKLDRLCGALEALVLNTNDIMMMLRYPPIVMSDKETTDEEAKHLRPAGAVAEHSDGQDADLRSYEDSPAKANDKRAGVSGTGTKKK